MGERSKEANADRLEAMAAEAGDAVLMAEQLAEELDACDDERACCAAEVERLTAIVDLCVLEFETRAPSERWGSAERADVFNAHRAAMVEEVRRRA